LGHEDVCETLDAIGHIPLPPYIDRPDAAVDRELYQTVFARTPGAVASPTAGLHFDEALLDRIQAKGVEILFVTLHTSYATFQPVACESIADHRMFAERYEITSQTARSIQKAKSEGRRIVACGTTVVRALESAARQSGGRLEGLRGETRLFIYPPYDFQVADSMITNFHMPRTTLLMLVSAFMGLDAVKRVYEEAIRERYRFYSYGDAMLVV
jgi:S-adenosylmethionine:tRNA ribosyltransferase-isomerase